MAGPEAELAVSGKTPELDEAAVLDYLRGHPDFLTRHPQLFELLELRHAAGAAVSLIERQVEILRGKSTRLEDRLKGLLDAARGNESRASNVHRLARSLIRAPTAAATVSALRKVLREDFDVTEVWIGVSSAVLKRHDIEGLYSLDPKGPVVKAFGNFFRTRLVECGPLDKEKGRVLFPNAAQMPASAAVVPLEKENDFGMLVLASSDPQRFQPRQGQLFLEMTAELVSAALRARLG